MKKPPALDQPVAPTKGLRSRVLGPGLALDDPVPPGTMSPTLDLGTCVGDLGTRILKLVRVEGIV